MEILFWGKVIIAHIIRLNWNDEGFPAFAAGYWCICMVSETSPYPHKYSLFYELQLKPNNCKRKCSEFFLRWSGFDSLFLEELSWLLSP